MCDLNCHEMHPRVQRSTSSKMTTNLRFLTAPELPLTIITSNRLPVILSNSSFWVFVVKLPTQSIDAHEAIIGSAQQTFWVYDLQGTLKQHIIIKRHLPQPLWYFQPNHGTLNTDKSVVNSINHHIQFLKYVILYNSLKPYPFPQTTHTFKMSSPFSPRPVGLCCCPAFSKTKWETTTTKKAGKTRRALRCTPSRYLRWRTPGWVPGRRFRHRSLRW